MKPPCIKYPDYPPYDTFWRQSGEAWLAYIWQPFWQQLSEKQKTAYLKKWNVPQVWQDFYFDLAWQKLLETLDNDDQ